MYFNKKWHRSGILFEGNFKAKLIETDEYLLHLSRYIHLNPIDMINSQWKEKGIKDTNRVKKFLLDYYWSSYPLYIKKLNSHLISTEHLEKIITNVPNYENFTLGWTTKEMDTLMPLTLETPVPVHSEAEPPDDVHSEAEPPDEST
jgi:putative transposase